mgnify:CR=1 FL=1|jgi:hypothetical protein
MKYFECRHCHYEFYEKKKAPKYETGLNEMRWDDLKIAGNEDGSAAYCPNCALGYLNVKEDK